MFNVVAARIRRKIVDRHSKGAGARGAWGHMYRRNLLCRTLHRFGQIPELLPMTALKRRKTLWMALTPLMFLSLAYPSEAFSQMGGGGTGGGGMRPPKGGPGRGPPGGPPPGAQRGRPQAKGDEFNPGTFSCLEYISGTGENATNRLRSVIAKVWIQGNLTGLHRGNGDLALSSDMVDRDALTERLDRSCRAFPTASILTISVMDLAKAPLKMPDEIFAGIRMSEYTCETHLAAKSSGAGDAIKSDIAEMWAFAFIQGYKLAKNPDVVIPMEAKPLLVGAMAKACAANRKIGFLDLTAQVAEKVKLQ